MTGLLKNIKHTNKSVKDILRQRKAIFSGESEINLGDVVYIQNSFPEKVGRNWYVFGFAKFFGKVENKKSFSDLISKLSGGGRVDGNEIIFSAGSYDVNLGFIISNIKEKDVNGSLDYFCEIDGKDVAISDIHKVQVIGSVENVCLLNAYNALHLNWKKEGMGMFYVKPIL